jgi:hypothetical protein
LEVSVSNPLTENRFSFYFEVSNSRNNFLGIMVPGFYVKYAVYEFKMSSKVNSNPTILTGSKKNPLEPKIFDFSSS